MTHLSNTIVINNKITYMETSTEIECRIISAARSVFVRRGFEAAKMTDIAAEAGISRTSLNYYYRTKERLFEAIFEHVIATLFPRLGEIVDRPMPFLEKIDAIIDQYTAVLMANPLLPAFIIGEIQRDADHLYGVVLRLTNSQPDNVMVRLHAQIEAEMAAGTIRRIPIFEIITSFVGLMVFPLLVKNVSGRLFFDTPDDFTVYIENRKAGVSRMIKSLVGV